MSSDEEEWKEELMREHQRANPKPKQRNLSDITPIILAHSRFKGTSESAVAAIANATLEAEGINLSENPQKIITKSKVHSTKEKVLTELSDERVEPTEAIFFDGKKFSTLHTDEVEGLYHRQTVETDDHYVVTDASRESYLGEYTVERGTGEAIGDGLMEFVAQKDGLNMDDITILGGDSTNANTGKHSGAIAHIEHQTGRTFHRFICLFHLIELLLRHFVGYYVGDTSGPRSFASTLGKAIVSLKDPVIVAFKNIECPNFPQIGEDILTVRS